MQLYQLWQHPQNTVTLYPHWLSPHCFLNVSDLVALLLASFRLFRLCCCHRHYMHHPAYMVLLPELSPLMLHISLSIPGNRCVIYLPLRVQNHSAGRNGKKKYFCLVIKRRARSREFQLSMSVPSGMYMFHSKDYLLLEPDYMDQPPFSSA